jgi:Fe-S-cluster containining protein
MNQFRCIRCGTCCRWPGAVRLTPADVDAISAHLGLTVAEFTTHHAVLTPDRRALSLPEAPDGSCAFLTEDNTCRINPVKPKQCREFPDAWNFPGWDEKCPAGKKAKKKK